MHKNRKTKSGFTLTEIMIVVFIIGALAAISIPHYMASRKQADAAALEQIFRQIHTTMEEIYWAQPEQYPPSLAEPALTNWASPANLGMVPGLEELLQRLIGYGYTILYSFANQNYLLTVTAPSGKKTYIDSGGPKDYPPDSGSSGTTGGGGGGGGGGKNPCKDLRPPGPNTIQQQNTCNNSLDPCCLPSGGVPIGI